MAGQEAPPDLEVESQPSEPDTDSAIGVSTFEGSTASVRASVYNFLQENGRRYHAFKSGKYPLPNDESEQERLDFQHHLFLLSLGELHLAPISKHPQNVLDIGTGTGIWVIDFAEQYPSAFVIGIDLSPIQPDYVPPNCRFEISDFEEEWTFNQKFDYIHGRALTSCLHNPPEVITSAFNALNPGGYLELQDPTMPVLCIDDTLNDTALARWSKSIIAAGDSLERSWTNSRNYKKWMGEIGFVDLHERRFVWPLSPWPRGKKEKLVATWVQQDLLDGLQGLSMGLLTRGLGWSAEEVDSLLADVRKEVKDRKIHAYIEMVVVYGRKP